VPALAVADALRAEGAFVSFIGTRRRAEVELVPEADYEIDFISVQPLDRRNPRRAAAAGGRAGAAAISARRILRRRRADVVIGGGGYVSGPVGLAAVLSRRPLILTEADSRLGLANRLLARFARRVCLSFPIPGHDDDRYLVTGRPVPEAILTADRVTARARFGVAPDARCLLVVGGSLGARSINETAIAAFAGPERATGHALHDLHVIQLAGRRDYPLLRERLAAAGPPDHYTLLEYEPDLGDCLAAADLVIARAGGSVFEIAAAGRPAILVPYPHAAGGHQAANADWMALAGAAVTMPDSELSPARVAAAVGELLSDSGRLESMAVASRSLARPDAARQIAREALEAMR
jgi:UDP-N-acetylglucosamine--N-acetylmuramyl-(pentapeptide) pyrophosphoryl-undecaprenol N-acetylglucosamine transferase